MKGAAALALALVVVWRAEAGEDVSPRDEVIVLAASHLGHPVPFCNTRPCVPCVLLDFAPWGRSAGSMPPAPVELARTLIVPVICMRTDSNIRARSHLLLERRSVRSDGMAAALASAVQRRVVDRCWWDPQTQHPHPRARFGTCKLCPPFFLPQGAVLFVCPGLCVHVWAIAWP
jgi:hypothetical protein